MVQQVTRKVGTQQSPRILARNKTINSRDERARSIRLINRASYELLNVRIRFSSEAIDNFSIFRVVVIPSSHKDQRQERNCLFGLGPRRWYLTPILRSQALKHSKTSSGFAR